MLAEPVFSAGPLALGARPVPMEVLTALLAAAHDDNPRVGLEALYAFGALAVEPGGADRARLLRASWSESRGDARLGRSRRCATPACACSAACSRRRATIRPSSDTVGDAVITALNDSDRAVKTAAMPALGAMRYERACRR